MKELEDYPWFPNYLRKMQVEYIGFMGRALRMYEPMVEIIAQVVAKHAPATTHIIDLASGEGGAIRTLAAHPSLAKIRFLLTDLYPQPNLAASTSNIEYLSEPVSMLESLPRAGMRTNFNAFHHLSLEQKRQMLEAHAGEGILVAELFDRGFLAGCKLFIGTTAVQWIAAPFVKPFRLDRLFFTYAVPVNIFTIGFDGMVSFLRVRAPLEVVQEQQWFPADTYTVEGGTARGSLVNIEWLYVRRK